LLIPAALTAGASLAYAVFRMREGNVESKVGNE
jgi:hypothetical protein